MNWATVRPCRLYWLSRGDPPVLSSVPVESTDARQPPSVPLRRSAGRAAAGPICAVCLRVGDGDVLHRITTAGRDDRVIRRLRAGQDPRGLGAGGARGAG